MQETGQENGHIFPEIRSDCTCGIKSTNYPCYAGR